MYSTVPPTPSRGQHSHMKYQIVKVCIYLRACLPFTLSRAVVKAVQLLMYMLVYYTEINIVYWIF